LLSGTNSPYTIICYSWISYLLNHIYIIPMDKKNNQRKAQKKNLEPGNKKTKKFKDPKDEVIYWQNKVIDVLIKTSDLQKNLLNEILLEKRSQVRRK
jgi:hypothetical protein